MNLTIVSRDIPDLPLSKLRAINQLTELSVMNLRFTDIEAASFLNQVMGLSLTKRNITELEKRTEGWVVGLQLAALSIHSDFQQVVMTGYAGTIEITPSFLLLAAVCLEIPIAMVLLSRLLKYRINRWANIIAGVFTILFVIGGGSATPNYIFFATIEVVCLLLIIRYAWKWTNAEGKY